jgi:release factor glutamine methyltransferase
VTSAEPMDTVGQALARARQLGIDRLDAQLLLAHRLGRPREWVIAHDDAALTDADVRQLAALFARRADGEPLAYLVGEREFRGLVLRVGPDVLVPRPDTETLVEWALDCLSALPSPRVLDLGTGSGAIALAIKHACSRAEVHASDRSVAALAVARANGSALGLQVHWHEGVWWDAVAPGTFDLVVANPPYVAAGDPHLAALRHEPLLALVPQDDRGDGMADLARIVAGAPPRLRPGAWLLLEHGPTQDAEVHALLAASGLADACTRNDLAGRPRVSGARHRSGSSH